MQVRAPDRVLRERQRLAGGDAELPFDEVEPGDRLGDGVLDLEARVRLDEVPGRTLGERASLDQELDRARAGVAGGRGQPDGGPGEFLAQCLGDAGGGRLLHDLLVPALERALALEHVHHAPVRVAEDLHLDVPRRRHQPLEQHALVAERRLRLALRAGQRLGELLLAEDRAHAAPATARRGLDHERKAGAACGRDERALVLPRAFVSRHRGDAEPVRERARLRLVAELAHGRRGWPDEHEPGLPAGLREIGVLGEEAVAGVDAIGASRARAAAMIVLAAQIALRRRRRAEDHVLVAGGDVRARRVGLGGDRHGGDAEAAGGARDAARDLAAIGDEHLLQHRPFIRERRDRGNGPVPSPLRGGVKGNPDGGYLTHYQEAGVRHRSEGSLAGWRSGVPPPQPSPHKGEGVHCGGRCVTSPGTRRCTARIRAAPAGRNGASARPGRFRSPDRGRRSSSGSGSPR